MVETYIVRANGRILGVYETQDGEKGAALSMISEGIEGELVLVPTPFEGNSGQYEDEFDSAWKLRPVVDRLAEGLIPGGERLKIINGYLIPKTHAELVRDGIEKAPVGQRMVIDEDGAPRLVPMTMQEQIATGQIERETAETIMALEIRADRAALLSSTDWTQAADSPLSADERARWAAYRQALRDIPVQGGFPWTIQWPIRPDGITA